MIDNQKVYVFLQDQQKQFEMEIEEIEKIRVVKKKILTIFGYDPSQTRKIALHALDVYTNQPPDVTIPISNQIDFKFIVNFLVQQERTIKFKVLIAEGEQLEAKQVLQSQKDQQLVFDQNGSVIQKDDNFNDNVPTDTLKYRGSQHIRCAFCNKSNKDKNALKICGGLYGPFVKNKFTHLNCALWCVEVFIDDRHYLMEQFQNKKEEALNQVIRKSQQKFCYYCKKKGAGLKCNNKKCNRKFHYECGYDNKCRMNWKNFMILCHKCKDNEGLCYQYLIKPNQYTHQQMEEEINCIKYENYEIGDQSSDNLKMDIQ